MPALATTYIVQLSLYVIVGGVIVHEACAVSPLKESTCESCVGLQTDDGYISPAVGFVSVPLFCIVEVTVNA